MPELEDGFVWPDFRLTQRAVAERLESLLLGRDPVLRALALTGLRAPHGILGEDPHSATTALLVGCALSAGGVLEHALWAAAAMELVMVSADLLDDVADAETSAYAPHGPGVVLTIAAGLLALATAAVQKAPEDGASYQAAATMGSILGEGFVEAAEGQARSLNAQPTSPLAAYHLAAAKSGPFGALAARMGSTLGALEPDLQARYGRFGRHFSVYSQLLNDTRDAAPSSLGVKSDVRAANPTVPLVFTHAAGIPDGLEGEDAVRWEVAERNRIVTAGGLAASFALAEAERVHGLQELDALHAAGRPVAGLRLLLSHKS